MSASHANNRITEPAGQGQQARAVSLAAEEVVAQATAQLALDEVGEALNAFALGGITMMDLLGRIAGAGMLATRSMGQGWSFLYETTAP